MSENKTYNRGVPTEPDVTAIMNKYPEADLIPGLVIKYEDIMEIIGKKGHSRFMSVTGAWKAKLEKGYNILIGCVPGGGAFIVLPENGKVNVARQKLISSANFAKRSATVSGMVNTKQLTTDELATHNFCVARSGNIIASAQLRREITALPEM